MFAMALMIASSTAMSFGGLIVRSMDVAGPWQINFYRSLGAFAAISLILLVRYRGAAVSQLRCIGSMGLFGGALLAAAGIAFLQALINTTVANTLFTLSAIPFIAAVLARVFLKERLQRATLVTMAVAALGIIVMLAEGIGIGSIYGNAMALLTACCFASYAVIARYKRHIDMTPSLLVASALVALVAVIAGQGDLGITLHDLLLCLLWGGILSGFSSCMFIVASRHLGAAELTIFMLLEFALGPIWVWLFVSEVPTRWTLLGGAIVIAAVAIRAAVELRQRRRRFGITP
jgi:drug/metabolite transporter (DMT)-like permease